MTLLGKFLNPKNDFAFKRIFGTERNKDILIHFLNDMLCFEGDDKIQSVSYLKTNQDPDIASKKQSILDVLCVDQLGRQCIVEMQVAHTEGFEKRAQYYAAKAYARQLNEGDQYHRLKEIIFLAITDFVMFPEKEAYKSDHIVLDKVTYEHDLRDFYFTFLELPKFNKSIDELHTMIEKWAYFFKYAHTTSEKDLARIAGSADVIERAYEELNRFSWTEVELNTYEQEEKRERDAQAIIDYQINQALAQGVVQGKIEIARRLLKDGVTDNQILIYTQLTQEELEKLKEEWKLTEQ